MGTRLSTSGYFHWRPHFLGIVHKNKRILYLAISENGSACNGKPASLIHATGDLPVSAVCLALIAAHLELSERDAVEEELSCLQLSAGTECGRELLAWRRSCRSTIRRGPKLFPLERARSRRVRDRFRCRQIATSAMTSRIMSATELPRPVREDFLRELSRIPVVIANTAHKGRG